MHTFLSNLPNSNTSQSNIYKNNTASPARTPAPLKAFKVAPALCFGETVVTTLVCVGVDPVVVVLAPTLDATKSWLSAITPLVVALYAA